MIDTSPQIPDLRAALGDLARLVKTVRYYPLRHPAVAAAAAGAQRSFSALAPAEGHLLCTVRREGFLRGDQPVTAGQPAVKKLAGQMFARRIQTLMVLSDVSGRDLQAFARCLALEPAAIQNLGGISEVLAKARIVTLWVNETDLARIRARRRELEENNGIPGEEDEELAQLFELQTGESTDGEYDLERVVQELQRTESDTAYRHLTQELVRLARSGTTEPDPSLLLDAMLLLIRDMQGAGLSALRRTLARQTLDTLASDELLHLLVELLATTGDADPAMRQDIDQVLGFFPDRSIHLLMERLASENGALSRRFLMEAVIAQGAAAVPLLIDYLHDERWLFVRNAVALLGEIRAPESAACLPPLLQHRDVRVARETIRSLTKIGGSWVVGILLPLVEGESQELSRQALLSLGIMKHPAAVPTLLKLVSRPDPLRQQVDLKKGAIKALGEIGSLEAIPALAALLGRRRWWGRARFDELRAAAASALGEIGGSDPVPILERAAEDAAPTVARAAAQALKQIRKGE